MCVVCVCCVRVRLCACVDGLVLCACMFACVRMCVRVRVRVCVRVCVCLLLVLLNTGRTLHRYHAWVCGFRSGVTSPELLIMLSYCCLEMF